MRRAASERIPGSRTESRRHKSVNLKQPPIIVEQPEEDKKETMIVEED